LGAVIGQIISRTTFVSNKVFEQRLETINKVWAVFIEIKILVHKSLHIGYKKWREDHYVEAESLLEQFRAEIDKSQILLDYRIIEGFRKLNMLYMLYAEGNMGERFPEQYHSALSELAESINKVLKRRTQVIKLNLNV